MRFGIQYGRTGEIIKVELKDCTYRTLYKKKFNATDENAWMSFINALQNYGVDLVKMIKRRVVQDDWM